MPLAIDTSAAYVAGARTSKLGRLGIWGLLGGDEVGRRAGLYLLEDYDPSKRPLVMIHGLGSSPLIWQRLSNAVWAAPHLRVAISGVACGLPDQRAVAGDASPSADLSR